MLWWCNLPLLPLATWQLMSHDQLSIWAWSDWQAAQVTREFPVSAVWTKEMSIIIVTVHISSTSCMFLKCTHTAHSCSSVSTNTFYFLVISQVIIFPFKVVQNPTELTNQDWKRHSRFSFSTQIWHFCTIFTLRGLKSFSKKSSCPQWELNLQHWPSLD